MIEFLDKIEATIRHRPVVNGCPLREGVEAFDGKRLRFICVGEADQKRYPGEMALMPEEVGIWPHGWIASGDLVNVILLPSPEAPTKKEG